MSDIALKVENVSKLYRLGEVGTGTISHDLNRWWAKVRGKDDPFTTVGEINDRTSKQNSKGGYVWALKDINLTVPQGEVLGIIGKNGSGKSTLLKLLSKITAPTTGVIKAKGRIASLLEVGTGMHPEMSGRENVYLNGTILGMSKKEISNKFDEIMDFAGCAKYADTPVKRYSSGMKVRLGFAVAAFLEPEILIVDEVLAVGDAEFQKKAIGKMQDISSGEGRTVLFVSHNMGSIQRLCSNAILLDQGKLLYQGNTGEVVDKYIANNVFFENDCTGEVTFDVLNKQCAVASLRMINSKDSAINQINFGEPFRIIIKIKSTIKVEMLDAVIAINTLRDDYRVFTSSSSDQNIHFQILNNQEIEIVGDFNGITLLPNDYKLIVSLRSERMVFDTVFDAMYFTILEKIHHDQIVPHNGSMGVVRVYPSWQKA